MRSQATVRVLNGHTAHIFSGEQRNIIIERINDGATAEILPVEVGTVLDVQPSVGSGDEVLLRLTLEVRSLASTDPATNLPVVSLRTAQGALRAHDGETIAIAGLRLQQESRERRAIPILASLPLIGRFFQAPAADVSQTDLAIFLTPHIIRGPLPAQGGSFNG
jgi:type II secretory pathway component GspD/PulD (secretin)